MKWITSWVDAGGTQPVRMHQTWCTRAVVWSACSVPKSLRSRFRAYIITLYRLYCFPPSCLQRRPGMELCVLMYETSPMILLQGWIMTEYYQAGSCWSSKCLLSGFTQTCILSSESSTSLVRKLCLALPVRGLVEYSPGKMQRIPFHTCTRLTLWVRLTSPPVLTVTNFRPLVNHRAIGQCVTYINPSNEVCQQFKLPNSESRR